MSIYEKKYQIFVSSTYIDLVKAREEVIKVILSLYQIPIGMEMFSADNDEQWSVIKATIESSDYYILIIGHRYGSLTVENISYTEKEFDYAKSQNIPVLAFIKNRDIATTPKERDDENEKAQMLKQFLSKVTSNSMCDFWSNENELGQKIAISLAKIFFKTPRIGWIRASKSSFETTEELTKLIQENRELRDEISKINSVAANEQPKIEVRFENDISSLNFETQKFRQYDKIDFSSIPEEYKDFISQKEVESFNNELDENWEAIDIYKTKFEIFENIKNNYKELIIEITNEGKIKANDIFIDIKFPPEIILAEKEVLDDFEIPKKPKISQNPLERALKAPSLAAMEAFNTSFLGSIQPIMKNYKALNIHSLTNRNFRIDKETNTLTIKLSKLTQTRTVTIKDDIIIAPMYLGIFEVEINIICDEYRVKDERTLQITVQ